MKLTQKTFPQFNKYFGNDFELNVLLHHLDVEKNYRIIEVGCNETQLSNALHSLGCESWGVDVNKNPKAKFKFTQGNFQDIPLPENYFDIVIDVSAIHHFGIGHYHDKVDPDGDMITAKKIYRILKSNGLFYISTDRIGKEFVPNVQNAFRQYNIKEFMNRIVNSAGFKLLELKIYFTNCYPLKIANPEIDGYDKKQLFALLKK